MTRNLKISPDSLCTVANSSQFIMCKNKNASKKTDWNKFYIFTNDKFIHYLVNWYIKIILIWISAYSNRTYHCLCTYLSYSDRTFERSGSCSATGFISVDTESSPASFRRASSAAFEEKNYLYMTTKNNANWEIKTKVIKFSSQPKLQFQQKLSYICLLFI